MRKLMESVGSKLPRGGTSLILPWDRLIQHHCAAQKASSFVELFALRLAQSPPDWTRSVGALSEPIYLVKAAAIMKRLRTLCETEAPEPLRKRGFYAPPNFLEFA